MQPAAIEPRASKIDILLGTVTLAVLLSVFSLLLYTLLAQWQNYQRLLEVSISGKAGMELGMGLSFARAADAAVIKTCSIFLAFVLIFLGGLYTFRVGDALYRLTAEGHGIRGALETASPGLVMVTLGMLLICVAIWKEHRIDVASSPAPPNAVAVSTVSTSTAMPSRPESSPSFDQNDVYALNTVMALLDRHGSVLSKQQQATWTDTRPRLDRIRRTIAFDMHPTIRRKYDGWSSRYAVEPDFVNQLTPAERQEFIAVQQLLAGMIASR